MLNISIQPDFGRADRELSELTTKQMPFAVSLALNRVAEFARDALKSNMNVVFDRPKPFTMNSLRIIKATKQKPTARVFHTDLISSYLRYEIEGGQRGTKPFESAVIAKTGGSGYFVPGAGVRLDQYGNAPRAILNAVNKGVLNPNGRDPKGIFVIPEGSRSHLKPGIYRRTNTKSKTKGRGKGRTVQRGHHGIEPLFLSVPAARYEPRYDMEGVVGRVVQSQFNAQLNAALDFALSTAR